MKHPAQQEWTPTHPAHNPEQVRTTTSMPAPTKEGGELERYVKELEGKGKKPTKLLCLLQLAVEADCCTRSACHGTLFPFLVLTLSLRLRADGRCRTVQARLCRKRCRHVIGLGPYLLSMTSSPSALVAVSGFSSFHFRFAPLISAPFAIRRW